MEYSPHWSLFYLPEAALIKSLPLCTVPQPDILIWPKENSGIYSMKSGYKCLMEIATLDTVRPTVSVAQKSFWKNIWKLNIPGKSSTSYGDHAQTLCPQKKIWRKEPFLSIPSAISAQGRMNLFSMLCGAVRRWKRFGQQNLAGLTKTKLTRVLSLI